MPDWLIFVLPFYCVGAFMMMLWCISELSYMYVGENEIINKYGMYRGSTIITLMIIGMMICWLPILVIRYAKRIIKGV